MGAQFVVHWIHVLAGMIWIGTVCFFNFFLTPFVEKTRAEVRTEVFRGLVPLTLPGFRWGALVTLLTGCAIYLERLFIVGGAGFFNSLYGPMITVAALLGILMFLNGWFVMHPKQKVVVASAASVAQGGPPLPEAVACGRRVVLTSRTNLLLTIPTIFFMVAVTHYPAMSVARTGSSPVWFWILVLIILGAIEINALMGMRGATKKPLDSVAGTLWGGFILLAVFCVLFRMLL